MFLRYGSYDHAANEASVSIVRTPLRGPSGALRGYKEAWTISGMVQADNQVALTNAIAALKTAYSFDHRDLALCFDDGTPTNHTMKSSHAFGGLKVVQMPTFPEGKGAEYSTYRTYTVQVEGEFLDPTVQIVEWWENISYSGGGPLDIHLQPLNGKPVKQRVAEDTPYQATIDGAAVGTQTWPPPPAPLWPWALVHPRKRVTQERPRREGAYGQPSFTDYQTTWHYEFEANVPLLGRPRKSPV